MPHPENHVVARQHPRHRRDPTTADTLGLHLFRSAVTYVALTSSPAPFVDIELPLADRREGKVRVSYRLDGDEPPACS